MNALCIDDVSCWKGDTRLFQGVSFTLNEGDLTQLEGANGTGKTSLLRIIAGLSRPETGEVRWQDESIHQTPAPFHANLLYIAHKAGLKDVLTAYENLSFYQQASDQSLQPEAIQNALQKTGLAGYEDIPVKQLSAGQQRRVALARLHLSQAKIWLLDEPFTAIDKQGVADLIALFKTHCENKGIILFTSHQALPDATIKKVTLDNGSD